MGDPSGGIPIAEHVNDGLGDPRIRIAVSQDLCEGMSYAIFISHLCGYFNPDFHSIHIGIFPGRRIVRIILVYFCGKFYKNQLTVISSLK